MFSVMVTAASDAWEQGTYVWDKSRVFEHTADDVRAKLGAQLEDAFRILVGLPVLFMYETHIEGTPRIGRLTRIQQRGPEVRVIFEFDDSVPKLAADQIQDIKWELSLDDWEFYRTHWAVKDGDLYEILREAAVLPLISAADDRPESKPPVDQTPAAVDVKSAKVFLVHGRDEAAKHSVARFLEVRVGLQVVILSDRTNRGRSILTKFEQEAGDATFAVVIMTPDDMAHLRPELLPSGSPPSQPRGRPRQNVVFELGFFIGRLGADRVCALVSEGVERPSDYAGIVYVPFDTQDPTLTALGYVGAILAYGTRT
jgi:predicted nucleotide-binding protein